MAVNKKSSNSAGNWEGKPTLCIVKNKNFLVIGPTAKTTLHPGKM